MNCINYRSKLAGVLGLFMLNTASHATTPAMHVTLTRIQHLLTQVNPLITLAQQQQNPQARVQFQFKALRQDITTVQDGIAQALHRVTIQPRVVKPLAGDYLPINNSVLKKTHLNNEVESS